MNKNIHKTSIGGQAVMEGVMMRGPKSYAVAVRKPGGEIIIDTKQLPNKNKNWFTKLPIVRGCINFVQSLVLGTKTLMYSAEFVDLEEDEPSKFDKWLEDKLGDKIKDVVIYVSVVLSLFLSIGLFILLPTWIVGFTKSFIQSSVLKSLLEGVTRIVIFLVYLWAVSKMNDIKRVFQYHGAEHKTIACYEAGLELTPENAKKMTRLHPRCGTSFLLIVMVVSIIFFSFLRWDNVFIRSITRIALLPVVAGISYEIIKLAGKYDNLITKIISYPGLCLQKITTNEPDDSQLEVAIASMKAVLTDNPEEDKWQ
ncbi:MAG: DUF1385 domain-containing protein [Clostridia bacterium]|nr:DUF1385 domain-containing protein [Clostridia bacterium]